MRIQLRRYDENATDDLVLEGELVYDDQRRRLGVSVISDGQRFHFLPEADDELTIIGADEFITGRVSETEEVNNLVLDWGTADQVNVKHRISGEVVASFGVNGSKFNPIPGEVTSIASTRNLMANGSLAIKRNIGHQSVFQTDPGVSNEHMFAPNWLVWCTDNSGGNLSVQFDESDVNLSIGRVERVLSVTSAGNVSDCGVRLIDLDYSFVAASTVTIEFDYVSPAGEISNVAIMSSANGDILTTQIEGSGSWKRASIQVYMPAGNATWWGVDVLREPSANSSDPVNWKVGAVQVSKGAAAQLYERRSKAVEKNLVNNLYREGRVFIADDTDVKSVNLDSMLVAPTRVQLINSTDGAAEYDNLDITGFEVSIPDLVDTDGSVLKYAAYVAYPTT